MARLNLLEENHFEKLPVTVCHDKQIGSAKVAERIANLIQKNQQKGEKTVLGLSAGTNSVGVYSELVRMHREEGFSFKDVITFNLEEYYPMGPDVGQSMVHFMNENLFNFVDIDKSNVHIPDGTLREDEIHSFCLEYENKIEALGGLDLQILEIGRTGNIGFNGPNSTLNSSTRLITLDELTRRDVFKNFGGKEKAPTKAIAMGIGTILKAREIVMLAWYRNKAPIIRRVVEGEMSGEIPSTYLQLFNNASLVIDEEAASDLTRFDTPWLVNGSAWDEQL